MGPPPGWSDSDTSGSWSLLGSEELRSKPGVAWSLRPRMAEVVPKEGDGKKAGGGLEAGIWGAPGSVLSNAVEVGGGSGGRRRPARGAL